MLNIFSFNFERSLALQLSDHLLRKIPANSIAFGTTSKVTEKKVARAMHETFQLAVRKCDGRNIGIIRRSVLANNLKWRLKDGGYSHDFVNLAVEGLIFELAKKKVKPSRHGLG